MASLRQGYEEWVLNEPEELQSERPSDKEMAAFAEAEKKYAEEVRQTGTKPCNKNCSAFFSQLFSLFLNSSNCLSSKLQDSQ
jgi:hypothetical protein